MIEAFAPEPVALTAAGVRTTVRLRWRVTGARLVVIEGHASFTDQTSETTVDIDRETTFTLTAYGPGLIAVDAAACTVTAPPHAGALELPAGTIAVWHGDPVRIPRGWRLCDGRHGTPNLVDRFVLGAGPDTPAGTTGAGEPHVHDARQHLSGRAQEHDAHDHRLAWEVARAGRRASPLRIFGGVRGLAATGTPRLGGQATHAHDIRVERTLESTEAPPPRPPSYALCYIIRTADDG